MFAREPDAGILVFLFSRLVVSNCLLIFKARQFFVDAAARVRFRTSESEKSQGGEILAKEIRPGREAGGKERVEEGQSSRCRLKG